MTEYAICPPTGAVRRAGEPGSDDAAALDRVIAARVGSRLLPCLFLLYVIAYLDRINVGFAALTMNHELGLSSRQYGFLSGIFFLGYFLFEVPSNLILERLGARVWIARILVTWGAVSLFTAFAQNATQLYIVRFLLGVAEAGFFPGVLFYLTYWFRQRELARVIGVFMTALPAASILGAPASGWILDHVHGLGLTSWRWLLILEAVPAIVAGVLTYRMLPDGPAQARFLNAECKTRLVAVLSAEACDKTPERQYTVLHSIVSARALRLSAVAFLFMIGLYVTGFWMPQSIQAIGRGLDHLSIGLLVVVPNAIGLAAMVVVSWSSSRHRERYWHAALSLLTSALAFCYLGAASSLVAGVCLWSVAAAGLYGFIGPFWSIPGQFLAGRAAATTLASICSIGNLGGFVGLSAIGVLAERTGNPARGQPYVALALAGGALLLALQRHLEPEQAAGVRRATALNEPAHGAGTNA